MVFGAAKRQSRGHGRRDVLCSVLLTGNSAEAPALAGEEARTLDVTPSRTQKLESRGRGAFGPGARHSGVPLTSP